jgi:hypothetical protein
MPQFNSSARKLHILAGRQESRNTTDLLPSLLNHIQMPPEETQLFSPGSGFLLHSLGADPTENTVSIITAQEYLDCCLFIRCTGNLFTESLLSNKHLLWLRYSGFQSSCHNIALEKSEHGVVKSLRGQWKYRDQKYLYVGNTWLPRDID